METVFKCLAMVLLLPFISCSDDDTSEWHFRR